MTQEEIQERNKEIAVMLGVDINFSTQVYRDSKSSLRHILDNMPKSEDLKFHSDWNWLMEAVKFINNTHNQDNPYRDLTYTIKHLLNGGWWKLKSEEKLIPRRLLSDIEQLFLAVSDFAKLYNEGEL
jgi:hypothetical protein